MEKITPNMDFMDMMMVMSEGNPGALTVLMQILQDDPVVGFVRILTLDHFDIRGPKVWQLWKDCSGQDKKRFYNTIEAIKHGAFTPEEVRTNLGLAYSIPFLDASVSEADYAKDGKELEPYGDEWNNYIQACRAIFEPKLKKTKKEYEDMGFKF